MSHIATNFRIDKEQLLIQILEKKLAYYAAILELCAIEKNKLLIHAPLKEVLSQIKKKQILLDCTDQLEQELIPLKFYWKTKIDYSEESSLCVKRLLDELDHVLQKILVLSHSNQILFESVFSSFNEESLNLQQLPEKAKKNSSCKSKY